MPPPSSSNTRLQTTGAVTAIIVFAWILLKFVTTAQAGDLKDMAVAQRETRTAVEAVKASFDSHAIATSTYAAKQVELLELLAWYAEKQCLRDLLRDGSPRDTDRAIAECRGVTAIEKPPMKIVLETSSGQHVLDAEIPPFLTPPGVILWGTRVFVLAIVSRVVASGKDQPDVYGRVYREAFAHAIPSA